MALCVTRSNSGNRHFARERRHEMNIVYWADLEHAWMLIGRNPMANLEEMAKALRTRLNT
ncbi:hypothetical protein D3C78_1982580 [compost metagenome]